MKKSESETRVLEQFISETASNLKRIEDALLELKARPGEPEAVRNLFRSFHGIKGISGYVSGADHFGALSHEMESLLKNVQDRNLSISSDLLELILDCHDEFYRMLEDFQRGLSPREDWKKLAVRIMALAVGAPTSAPARTTTDSNGRDDVIRQQLAGLNLFFDRWQTGQMDPPLAAAVQRKLNLIKRSAESAADAATLAVLSEAFDRLEQKTDWSQNEINEFRRLIGTIGRPDEQETREDGGKGDLMEARVQVKSSRLHQLSTLIAELTIVDNRLNHELDLISIEYPELEERLRNMRTDLSQVSAALEKTTQRIQLIELSALFSRATRIVRKIAREEGKQVELTIHGANTEVDRAVVDLLGDPITHIIRNAIDHGIETPEEREKLGKPPAGRLVINANAVGKFVTIDIIDDGRGIDEQLVAEKAAAKGFISPAQARSMSNSELMDVLFLPGFTTTDRITDVSGRGVGMDSVQFRIREIGGRVRVRSELGRGTSIRLSFPNTFTLVNCLVIRCRDFLFAAPARYARETINIRPEMVERFDGRDFLRLHGGLVRLYDLEDVLDGLTAPDSAVRRHAFVLEAGNRQVVFRVDELVEVKTLSIRGLPAHLEHIKAYAGVTTLWSGQVAFFLHPLLIIEQFEAQSRQKTRNIES